jgi:phage terminase large subunit-like protein
MGSTGIDLHSRSRRIIALIEGLIVMAVTLSRPKYESIRKPLYWFEGNTNRFTYEAGPVGFDLYDRLIADET